MLKNNYYSIALNELEYLRAVHNQHFYQPMCAQCQQICEKLLKHVIYLFCTENRESESALRSHNLLKLNKIILDTGIDLKLDRALLSIVKDYYFNSRYPGDDFMILTREDYLEARILVDDIESSVKTYLKEEGYCLVCGNSKNDCLCD